MSAQRDRSAVFGKEHELSHRIEEILQVPPETWEGLFTEYHTLAKAYRKLLRNSEKMTRLADSGQNKLKKLMAKLETQNHQIEKQRADLEEANRKLEEASLTDTLTCLRNRRFLANFLETEIEGMDRHLRDNSNRSLLFLLLDIDRFKMVNDTFGHVAGDQVLMQIAKLISENCRKGDIPIRWGGEEFLMVCRDAERKFAPSLAERLRSQIEHTPFEIGRERVLRCTASIGFALFPFFPENPYQLGWEQVVDLADQGLYAAKKNGRNAWVGVTAAISETPTDALPVHSLETLDRVGLVRVHTSLPAGETLVW